VVASLITERTVRSEPRPFGGRMEPILSLRSWAMAKRQWVRYVGRQGPGGFSVVTMRCLKHRMSMNHIESIEVGLKENKPHTEIVRKVYLAYPTKVLVGDEERQYKILNAISCFLKVPIMSIQIAGSAKTGRSFHKQKDFVPGDSDLDVAVIDAGLYQRYMEAIFLVTKGYADNSRFPLKNGKPVLDEYRSYLNRGIFRPDLMPSCEERKSWNAFFGKLSREHGDLFKSINACIYMSQAFFESKQRSAIKSYIDNRVV